MSARTEERLRDVAIWYKEHVNEISDPVKRTEFLEKFGDQLLWLLTFYVEDLQMLEGRHSSQRSQIIIPHSGKFQ